MNTDMFFISDADRNGEGILLTHWISALQTVPNENGRATLGLLSQLGPGTIVEFCGKGFNDRTAKVRVQGLYYFVFLQDLESQAAANLTASVGKAQLGRLPRN